jgi:Icc-related predicted phosphoesterase
VERVRVLALADKRPPLDPALMAEQMGADAVVCLGDLDRAWIEPLAHLDLPRVGVHGNHDEPDLLREVDVQDLHGKRTSLGGMTFAGFEGCVRYGGGGPYHYTQREASKLARRLPAADVLLSHCPPLGINDDPDDPAHVGFEGLLDWVRRHRPHHLLHGHTHPLGGHVTSRFEDTRVHWISGARLVLLDRGEAR